MAFNKLNPQDFIHQTFPPMIAVMSTNGAEAICKKNNLNFTEMIRPFSKATFNGYFRDPTGPSVPIKHVRVSFTDINSRPPPLPIARSYFNQVINTYVYERTSDVIVGDHRLDIPISVPWFDAWRHTFLQVQYPSDHEFFKHYIGVLLVISSEDDNPGERLQKMILSAQELIQHGASKLPKWFTPPSFVLIAGLLLHDNSSGDASICIRIMEEMKVIFGSSKCFFLSINSQNSVEGSSHLPDPWAQFLLSSLNYREEPKEPDTASGGVEVAHEPEEQTSPSTPFIVHPLSPVTEEGSVSNYSDSLHSEKSSTSQHGKCLTAEDINRIKIFVNEFCVKALIPHFEHIIQILSEQISNKKGVSRSLFSATKRWFGSTRTPGSPGNNLSPTAIAYSNDSHELQLRRLGDISFMIGHYFLAYNAYHGAKRDFSADGAWLHYAGALEMAALAAFMTGNDTLFRKVIDYSEESIVTYQNSCRVNQFATRATLLSVECLKGRAMYGEAAKRLIRMCGEDSDLRSAVLLEQAAYCFLESRRPLMYRKYAFHMVLAGHRFNKAGHKNHSMRCYYQAYQVYEGKCWSVAEDHILYTIGKTASQLKLTTNAIEALSFLVKRTSRQTPHQQTLFLQEYITTIKQSIKEAGLGILSLPIIDSKTIKVILNMQIYKEPTKVVPASSVAYIDDGQEQDYVEDTKWWKLEEKLINHIESGSMIFKPTVEILTSKTDNAYPSVVISGESIGVCLNFCNPLHIPLKISDLSLMWWFQSEEQESIVEDSVKSESTGKSTATLDFVLLPDSNKNIVLKITPKKVGDFQVTSVSYTLSDLDGSYSVSGMQPLTVTLPSNCSYLLQDKRLHFQVVENAPQLQVSFTGLRRHIYSSELLTLMVHLKNSGNIGISRIYVMIGPSFSFWIDGAGKPGSDILKIPLEGTLRPGQKFKVPVFVYPNFVDTKENLELLFYYESSKKNTLPRYRLIRHSWPTTTYKLFEITADARRSLSLSFNDKEAINIKIHIGINKANKPPHPVDKLNMECVSLYSRYWRLTKNHFTPEDFIWTPDESAHFLIQALRMKPTKKLFTTVHFTEKKEYPLRFCILPVNSKNSEQHKIFCLINWRSDLMDEHGLRIVKGQECVAVDIDTDPSSTSSSFTPATLTIFGNPKPEETATQLKKLIFYQLEHSPIINHNFRESRLCTVPVTLWLQSSSEDVLFVKIDLVTLPKDLSEVDKVPDCFAWLGKTEFSQEIKGFERKSVPLKAAFTAPGAYDFRSRIAVLVKVKDEMILQLCQMEATVIVS